MQTEVRQINRETGKPATQVDTRKKLTLSRRDSSMLLEYSFSLYSSRSMRELSMSADRCGMLDTQATVRSAACVGGFRVEGDCVPYDKKARLC